MISSLEEAVAELRVMREAGVHLDEDSPTEDDFAVLLTSNPKVARKFGFEKVVA